MALKSILFLPFNILKRLNILTFIKSIISVLMSLKGLKYWIPLIIISSTLYTTFMTSWVEYREFGSFKPFIVNFGGIILNTDEKIRELGVDFNAATTDASKLAITYNLIGLTIMFLALPIAIYLIYKILLGHNASTMQYLIIVIPLYIMLKISGSLLLTGEFPTFISGTIEVYTTVFEYVKLEIITLLNSNSINTGIVNGYSAKYNMTN